MNAPLNAERLLSFLGASSDRLETESLWTQLNTLSRPELSEEEEDRYHDWVLVRRRGLELGFVDSEYAAASDRAQWGHGELILSQLYFYSGHSDIQRFEGAMPFGLQWDDTRAQARARLVQYESTRHSHLTDTWDVPGYRLTVVYNDDSDSLQRIVCRRQPAPLEPSEAMRLPALQDLVAALGESITAPSFERLWQNGFWSAEHVTAAREDDEIDLNAACGLTLSTSSDKGLLPLRSVTFHRNRDQEGSGWRGELPAGLDFEDSPEDLFRKLGATPVQQSDSALTGHGVWHLADVTLHVLYSNVDNRLIRVKMLAPGTWRSVRDE